MNLFLADSLNISIQLLFAVLVIVSLLLLGVVLMQRPKQEGLLSLIHISEPTRH